MFARLKVGNISQQVQAVRNATKKVSGSKTNKNDSAGRRLGPKAYEGHFVKPGQILMRQRGTKIHPGENTGIGVDHTIYATEPGYVRFYYDPFHPLRKYVGVALKKELALPTPHFEPRVRRFGYVELTDADAAAQEEAHMLKKEYDAQPFLAELAAEREQATQDLLAQIKLELPQFDVKYNDAELAHVHQRLLRVTQLAAVGQLMEEAKAQATFDAVFELELKGAADEVAAYRAIADDIDAKIDVDALGHLCPHLLAEQRQARQQQVREELSTYANKLLSAADREAVAALIGAPGVFSAGEQEQLEAEFLPPVLPYDVPGLVIEDVNPEKPPKGVVVQRVFDEATRTVKTIGRPKEAFA